MSANEDQLKEARMVTGSCLCGGVKFRIHGELAPIQICSKANWWPINDDLPQYAAGWAPPKPG